MKIILFIIAFFCININAKAQWQPTNGPYGNEVNCFAVNGSVIFAATGGAVYSTNNNGVTWSFLNNGWPNPFYNGLQPNVNALLFSGSNLFAGTESGVFLSTNNGASWTIMNNGLADSIVYSLMLNGTDLLAGTSTGIYKTNNNGSSWTFSSIGIPNSSVKYFTKIGSNIFAGTSTGVYLSANNGLTWSPVNNGLNSTSISGIGAIGSNLFVATYLDGVYKSTDNGGNWTIVNNNLPSSISIGDYSLQAVGTSLFVGKSTDTPNTGGLFRSTNNGVSWTQVNTGLSINAFQPTKYNVFPFGSNLLVGSTLGTHISSDNGITWYGIGLGKANIAHVLMQKGSDLYCGTINGLYVTSNSGNTWNSINNGFNSNPAIKALCYNGNRLFAGTATGWTGEGIYISDNNGASWTQSNSGLTNLYILSLATINGNIFAGTADGMFISTNNGATWSAISTGLPTNTSVYNILSNGPVIFIATGGTDGLYISTNSGTSWASSIVDNGVQAACFVNDGNNVLCGTNNNPYVSSNYGSSWSEQASYSLVATGNTIVAMVNTGSMLIAAAQYNPTPSVSVVTSIDGGANWAISSNCYMGIGARYCSDLATDNTYVFLATTPGGYMSPLNGVWRNSVSSLASINCSGSFSLTPDVNTPHNWFAIPNVTGNLPITYLWDWGDGSSSSGSNPSHIYSAPGYYNICLTTTDAIGCTDTYCDASTYIYKTDAEIITINVVDQLPSGIDKINEKKINIYPNPAITEITVNGYSPAYLRLCNTLGQTVAEVSKSNKLYVGNLSQGIYVLQLFDEKCGLVKTEKIVKE